MSITFGGKRCLDPLPLLADCQQQRLPVGWWAGRPNSFRCLLGQEPGEGWILLDRASIDSLSSINDLHDLVFSNQNVAGSDAAVRSVTLKNLVVVHAEAVSPGASGGSDTPYLVELADRRRLYRNIPINAAYNVRQAPGNSSFHSGTLTGGSQWTWTQMVQNIWEAIGTSKLGAYAGLPFSPDGSPENFIFYGASAWDSLGIVLARLACALKLDPITDAFTIVRLGATDATATAALDTHDSDHTKIWDDYPLESVRARIPAQVRVHFPKQPQTPGSSPWYTVDQSDPTADAVTTGQESSTKALLYDDLPALYNASGVIQNAAALTTRATDRVTDYYRNLWQGQGRLHRIYGNSFGEAGLRPASIILGTSWEDRGAGYKTEVIRGPRPAPFKSAETWWLKVRDDAGSPTTVDNTWIVTADSTCLDVQNTSTPTEAFLTLASTITKAVTFTNMTGGTPHDWLSAEVYLEVNINHLSSGTLTYVANGDAWNRLTGTGPYTLTFFDATGYDGKFIGFVCTAELTSYVELSGVLTIPGGEATSRRYTAGDWVVFKAFNGRWRVVDEGRKSLVNAQTGTSYTVTTHDEKALVTLTNASSVAVMLPQAGASGLFLRGWSADFQNRGAGTATITPTTSTIDGAATLALTTNQGVRIFSDGTNYFTQRGIGGGGSSDVSLLTHYMGF